MANLGNMQLYIKQFISKNCKI